MAPEVRKTAIPTRKSNQIRDNAYGSGKAFFGSFYKGIVYIDFLP